MDDKGARLHAATAAESLRADLLAAERSAAQAQETAQAAAREASEKEDLFSAVTRRHHRALKEVSDASALLERLSARELSLNESVARIDEAITEKEAGVARLDASVVDARRVLAETESRQEEARERRTQKAYPERRHR